MVPSPVFFHRTPLGAPQKDLYTFRPPRATWPGFVLWR